MGRFAQHAQAKIVFGLLFFMNAKCSCRLANASVGGLAVNKMAWCAFLEPHGGFGGFGGCRILFQKPGRLCVLQSFLTFFGGPLC